MAPFVWALFLHSHMQLNQSMSKMNENQINTQINAVSSLIRGLVNELTGEVRDLVTQNEALREEIDLLRIDRDQLQREVDRLLGDEDKGIARVADSDGPTVNQSNQGEQVKQSNILIDNILKWDSEVDLLIDLVYRLHGSNPSKTMFASKEERGEFLDCVARLEEWRELPTLERFKAYRQLPVYRLKELVGEILTTNRFASK